jgi:hypothetical protein
VTTILGEAIDLQRAHMRKPSQFLPSRFAAPRSTPNELLLSAVTLFSQGPVAAWPLAVAAEDCQHAIHHCLGSRAAFQASLGPISKHEHNLNNKQ